MGRRESAPWAVAVLPPPHGCLPTLVVEAESIGSVGAFSSLGQGSNSDGTRKKLAHTPAFLLPTLPLFIMLSLKTSSPFDLIERLERQVQSPENQPAAEVHESDTGYLVVLELPGVDKDTMEVKVADRSLSVSAERRVQQPADSALLSEIHYGTLSRCFCFAQPIDREKLHAHYRDGLLTVTLPKAATHSTVSVRVGS